MMSRRPLNVSPSHETRRAVRVLSFLDEDILEEESIVFCPFRVASTNVRNCLGCADFARKDGSAAVVCARDPPITDEEAVALVAGRRICSGAESLAARTPLGVVTENAVVCATPATRQRAAVTVDDLGRVTGVVSDLDVLRWVTRAAHGHMSRE